VLLAVSGGSDSVALLRAMAALKTGGLGRLCVAHFNHKLREDSDRDEQFVAALCRQLNVPCETGHAEPARLSAAPSSGIEETARNARYAFFRAAAGRLGARFVVTAHTADDQAETILYRILRGTGIAGLAGMARSRRFGPATLLRPLLTVRRSELVEYLRDIGQGFCSDPSNADRRFTRNRIRHELLPLLARQYNSGVADALLRLGSLAAEVQGLIDELVEGLSERTMNRANADSVEIDAAALAAEPQYLLRELLMLAWRRQAWPMQAMGFAEWDQLAQMVLEADRPSPGAVTKRILPGNVEAEIGEGRLRLARNPQTER
jgi:tRNA(Ile)-lysidine synthase